MVECPLPTLLDRISHLKRALPDHVWMPLQYIFHGSELRKYFRNMQWLNIDEENDNDKGLQNFHVDHETLVNILRSHDATDELLMIIEPLEPVVQLFFYLERHCNCLNVHELVTNLMNDQDIQTLLQDTTTMQDDIYDLSGRIHSLQDLFQNICHLPAPPTDTTSTSGKKRKKRAGEKNYQKIQIVKTKSAFIFDICTNQKKSQNKSDNGTQRSVQFGIEESIHKPKRRNRTEHCKISK